ncbi:MAG: hypothetical protein ACPG4X_14645 [Pikeienuella sp.]
MATNTADVIDRADFPAAQDGYEEERETDRQPIEILSEYIESDNIADMLDDTQLGEIGRKVVDEFEIDKQSRADWEQDNKDAMDLALQVAEKKNYPWPGASNVKYPLLTTAAIQFAARAYPAIVPAGNVVKAKVVGKDENGEKRNRAGRVSRHMSYQLTEQMTEWEGDTDKLVHVLPISGMAYRKTYRDNNLGRNKSILVLPDKVVINNNATDIETVPRITHILDFYPHEIEERFRSGLFKRAELGVADGTDPQAKHEFLEQHRLLDLDDDGYDEPYIVTVHKDTSEVVRIVANFDIDDIAFNEAGEIAQIQKGHYFIKYGLLPNPSGGWHDIGLGYLLRSINESVNTAINQLLDRGHLNNVGGGFIGSGARLRGGVRAHRPGEWKPVNVTGQALRDNLVPLPVSEPSPVLFQLLGLLIEAGKDISAVKDVMTGEAQGSNQSPTTTLALIEQGMQVFTAMYKRIFRSLKAEFALLYKLNAQHLEEDEYFEIMDQQEAVAPDDYAEGDFDIVPVADPNVVTNMQKLGRAQFMFEFRDDPYFDGIEIRRRMLEAANIEDADDLVVDEVPPNPQVAMKADEMDLKKRKQAMDEQELALKADKAVFEIGKMKAETMKLIAEAEAAEAGPQIQAYKTLMDELNERERIIRETRNDGGSIQGVEGQPGNQAVSGVS